MFCSVKINSILCSPKSCSEKILKLMRPEDQAEEINDTIDNLRRSCPALELSYQISPIEQGEKDENIWDTLNYRKE